VNFNEYQLACHETAVYPRERSLEYLSLGLCGEAGEVANKVKKIIRDEEGVVTEIKALELVQELGDVLWYVAELAGHLGWDLEQVAIVNREKLRHRRQAGKLQGSGDNR